jgi:hypothetical protein
MKTVFGKAVVFSILSMMLFIFSGANMLEVLATAGNSQTIRMGDNETMNRDEFTAWRNRRGIRHLNVDGRIYPACIFFNGANGQSFSYGELNNGILYVVLRPTAVIENVVTPFSAVSPTNEYITRTPQENGCFPL